MKLDLILMNKTSYVKYQNGILRTNVIDLESFFKIMINSFSHDEEITDKMKYNISLLKKVI